MGKLQHSDVDAAEGGGFYYPGPVSAGYERDFSNRKTFIAGPTGGGKSFSSSRKCLNATLIQKPSPKDHIRRAKIVVLCPTDTIMENTVVPSFKKVMKTEGRGRHWEGSKARPQDFTFKANLKDGSKAHMLLWWRAVGDLDYDEFFRGLECTFFWLPETDTSLTREMMGYCANRWGREYLEHVPPGESLNAYGMFGDSNTPFVGTYFHELFYLKLMGEELVGDGETKERADAGGIRLYKQPAGFDPNAADGWPRNPDGSIRAENWQMLTRRSPQYYREAANDMEDPAMVKRLLQCIPTSQRFGAPVHEDFDPDFHATHMRLKPDPFKKVIIGIDSTGLRPAAIFYQRTEWGQWRALAELTPMSHGTDLVDLGRGIKRILQEDFGGAKGGAIGCFDPGSLRRVSTDKRYQEWQIIQQNSGVQMIPAPTNDPRQRRLALSRLLRASDRQENRNVPRYLVSRDKCPNLLRALSGNYAFKKRGDVLNVEVDKNNPFTDVGEAAEYAPLTIEGIDGKGERFSAHSEREARGESRGGVEVQRKQRSQM